MLSKLRRRFRGGVAAELPFAPDNTVFYDLSEFVAGPLLTGIQRVAHRLWREWPSDPQLVLGFIGADGAPRHLPEEFGRTLKAYFEGSSSDRHDAVRAILSCARGAQPIPAEDFQRFLRYLIAEAFHNPVRVQFYRRLAEASAKRMHAVVYDALVHLHPEFFPPGATEQLDPYIGLLRLIPNLHFISKSARSDYCAQVLGRDLPTYRVLGLGCDSLGRASPHFDPGRRRFTCLGTIEPRKNHRAILAAFERLWRDGVDADLAFVGKLGWTTREPGWRPYELESELERLARATPRFRWERELGDRELSRCIVDSRATLYVSEHEGFGLPPVESLALGVPTVVSMRLPSLAEAPELGQIRLAEVTAATIADAVQLLCSDDFAEAKAVEIAGLRLPGWSDIARGLHRALTSSNQPSEA